MKVKFLRTVSTYFGTFGIGTVHELEDEQVSYLIVLNPDDFELVGEKDAD